MENIPIEILGTIIDIVDTPKRLTECRLVYKRWDSLSKKAMFGQKINISHHEAAWAFFDHLMKDPSKGKLVAHLNIGEIHPTTIQLKRKLLRLTFSSNIEVSEGKRCPPEFFGDMIDNITKSNDKFENLKIVPHPSRPLDNYLKLIEICNDILQDIVLDDHRISSIKERTIKYLVQFRCLVHFAICVDNIDMVNRLKNILMDMPQIHKLTLCIEKYDYGGFPLTDNFWRGEVGIT